MAFLYPSFLWALLALAIPVLVHLFNFRRYRKVMFPNVRLLLQIDHQTKSGNKLKKYLILAARLLAIAFLVLAFAQPVILHERQLEKGKNHVSILLDNSYSMNLPGNEGPLLEAAKNRARAIVMASGNGDEFNIITSDLDPSLLHFSGREATLENIDRIRIGNNTFPLRTLLNRQNSSLLEKDGNRLAYCISDFQTSNSGTEGISPDSSIRSTWIKLQPGERDNFSIDTCYLQSPILQTGQPITIVCVMSNYTGQAASGKTVELWVDGKPKGVAVFNPPAYSSEKQQIVFTIETGGSHRCELRLPGDNIPLDDILYFNLKLNISSRVTCISKSGEKYISSIFSDNPGFVFRAENSGNINYSEMRKQDLIVLQGAGELSSGLVSELLGYIRNGGSVLAFPDKDLPRGGFGLLAGAAGFSIGESALREPMKAGYLDLEHPIFRHIFENKPKKPDLPSAAMYFETASQNGIPIIKLANGKPFLSDIRAGKGHLLLSAVALDPGFGNFQNHALIVPIGMRAAMISEYRNPLYHDCSSPSDIYTGLPFQADAGLNLKGEDFSFVPEAVNRDGELYLNTNGEVSRPGHYRLYGNRSDSSISDLSFNSARTESDTRCPDESAFLKQCTAYGASAYAGTAEQLGSELHKLNKGTSLWKWCILFSLLCLLIEILLIRFFRTHVSIPV